MCAWYGVPYGPPASVSSTVAPGTFASAAALTFAATSLDSGWGARGGGGPGGGRVRVAGGGARRRVRRRARGAARRAVSPRVGERGPAEREGPEGRDRDRGLANACG